jgi:cation transporter-like permease
VYDQIASNKFKSVVLIIVFVLLVLLIGWVFGEAMQWGYAGLVLAFIAAFAMAWGS